MICSFPIIEDQDITLNMIKDLCKLKYCGGGLRGLVRATGSLGHEYLRNRLKLIKSQYESNQNVINM